MSYCSFVDDANNHRPVFAQVSYALSASAYSTSGVTVGSVTATDEDTGTYGVLTYSLSPASTFFTVFFCYLQTFEFEKKMCNICITNY